MVLNRRSADLVLFGVTSTELAILCVLTPTFTVTDWIYVLQHVIVLVIALKRPPPQTQDRSLLSNAAVAVAYGYPYAQVIYLNWIPGNPAWPTAGFFMVTFAACLSFASLLALGQRFGVRPALRSLVTRGPYRIVRHPMYLSYIIGDVGYNLQESNIGTIFLMLSGWASLLYRIYAEERQLSQDSGWTNYAELVRYRLVPGLW